MNQKQIDAIAHGIWVFVAGALAVFLSWGIGALTGHTVSLPIVLTPFIPLFVALAAYVLHILQPDAPVQPTPPPAQLVTPPFPPTPPAPPVS